MIRILFAAAPERWPDYEAPLAHAFAEAGLDVDLAEDHPSASVDYIIYAPNGPLADFTPYTRTKAVLSLWAGVENVAPNPTLIQPLARMVDSGLTEGMIEWVTGHVLRHHLGIDFCLAHQDGRWTRHVPPLARNRPVGVLGLGELGRTVARALAALNFDVAGWSRRPKVLDGIATETGDDGLRRVLQRSEILVLLLPLTDETEGLMNAGRLALLPRGAMLLNPGRGALIDDAALIAALETGQLGHATLDVFREEPLPPEHPFWAHPGVTVTPHVASETRPESASAVIAENVRRSEAGEPLLYLVDRTSGY